MYIWRICKYKKRQRAMRDYRVKSLWKQNQNEIKRDYDKYEIERKGWWEQFQNRETC